MHLIMQSAKWQPICLNLNTTVSVPDVFPILTGLEN